jgi:acyl-CoA synthetase (NDP forming)
MVSARTAGKHVRIRGVLVQPMIPAGIELMAGARIDPQLGPLILVGLGGILVELLKDVAIELAPVTAAEARGMLERLKGAALLRGFRGSAPVDIDQLCDVIVRLSEFAADNQEGIIELDVNPLICAANRIVAVDALLVRRHAAIDFAGHAANRS